MESDTEITSQEIEELLSLTENNKCPCKLKPEWNDCDFSEAMKKYIPKLIAKIKQLEVYESNTMMNIKISIPTDELSERIFEKIRHYFPPTQVHASKEEIINTIKEVLEEEFTPFSNRSQDDSDVY